VKGLEDYLGVRLFRRMNRALLLTDEGQTYLPAVADAFDRIRQATSRLVRPEGPGALTVSVLPSFAARWLVPRLGRFRRAHPDVDLRIDPSPGLVDFARGDVDVAIRYGRGHYPGLHVERLMAEDVFPVCSPALLRGEPPLRRPADLAGHNLLHDDGHGEWRTWLLAAGVEGVDPAHGTVFTDSAMLIDAAIDGQGVALARGVLAAGAIAQGVLVRPFDLSLPAQYAYYVVCPRDLADSPRIAAFRTWIVAEAGADAAPG
jgi:LysR family glycine cleavage system transcriptional activator